MAVVDCISKHFAVQKIILVRFLAHLLRVALPDPPHWHRWTSDVGWELSWTRSHHRSTEDWCTCNQHRCPWSGPTRLELNWQAFLTETCLWQKHFFKCLNVYFDFKLQIHSLSTIILFTLNVGRRRRAQEGALQCFLQLLLLLLLLLSRTHCHLTFAPTHRMTKINDTNTGMERKIWADPYLFFIISFFRHFRAARRKSWTQVGALVTL